MTNKIKEPDWGNLKSIADEPHWDKFVNELGGRRISDIYPNPKFQNADYIFEKHKVLIELKIIETDFGDTEWFQEKVMETIRRHVQETGMRGPLLGQPYPPEFAEDYVRLFRPPLGRIAKKANRQIKETISHLGLKGYEGVLLIINDSFKSLEPDLVVALISSIMLGNNSTTKAFIYLTNHYVDTDNGFANIIWFPAYGDYASFGLHEFIDELGRKWFDFCEQIEGPSDNRIEGAELSITGAKTIR